MIITGREYYDCKRLISLSSPYVLTDSRVLIPCRTLPCASNCYREHNHGRAQHSAKSRIRKLHKGSKIRCEEGKAYVERAVPLADVKVEETMQVVDAHGLVLVHLRRPRDCRAGGVQPAAPEWGEARGGEKAVAVPLALRLREGGGGEAEAHESFRHGEWSG